MSGALYFLLCSCSPQMIEISTVSRTGNEPQKFYMIELIKSTRTTLLKVMLVWHSSCRKLSKILLALLA